MKLLLKLVFLCIVIILTFGCARNYYNIPREDYKKQVRNIGIAPIFVDADSDIRHPDKEPLVTLVKDANRKNEKELIALLKDTGVYFTVKLIEGDPDQLFSNLFFRRERRDDAGVIYNKYFFKGEELRDLITKNQLDAVMVLVVSGLTRKDTVHSRNLLTYLESDYNYLVISAQVLNADGNILWEFPNFRERLNSFPPLLALQYPDFDEADANVTDKVDVKFKTIPGITRAFAKSDDSSVQKDAKVSKLYAAIFDNMISLLKPEWTLFGDNGKEEKPATFKPEASQPMPK
ncbi:MAG: hypothetical protein WA140_12815 [Geobacteraceae bacterium]